MEGCVSSTGRNRPLRNCVIKARKIKREKAKEKNHYYFSLFYKVVYYHCSFMFNLLKEIEKDPSNLSFERKYDEVQSELYSFCAQWKSLIELKLVYFTTMNQPDLKAGFVYFNYKNPKEFVGRESMKRAKNKINEFKGMQLKVVFQKKRVDRNSDSIEAFGRALDKNFIERRLDAYLENKVDPLHIKNFPTVRFSKKMKGDNCNICLNDFKTNEKLFKMKCGKFLHNKCLKDWLKKSNYCPLCKEILS